MVCVANSRVSIVAEATQGLSTPLVSRNLDNLDSVINLAAACYMACVCICSFRERGELPADGGFIVPCH